MKAISMVVIDDIQTVVQGIVNRFQWEDYGIQITGMSANGDDGLHLIKETKPDIVVTDIHMPKLSGIDMVRNVLSIIPNSKIIFISGYSDFDNAQQALRLGAFDYVMKPFTSKQLLEVILKAKDLLQQEQEHREQNKKMERMLRESMPMLRQEYLNLLIRYASNPQTVKKRWDFLEIEVEDKDIMAIVVEIDHFYDKYAHLPVHEIELVRFTVQNILEETLRQYVKGILFRDGSNRFVCLVNITAFDAPMQIAERMCRHVAQYSKHTVSIGVGIKVERIYELPVSYQQALTALAYNFYTGGNSVFFYEDMHGQRSDTLLQSPSEREKELFYAIRSGNGDKVREILNLIFQEWKYFSDLEKWPSPEKMKFSNMELVLSIHREFSAFTEDKEEQLFEQKFKELVYGCPTIDKWQKKTAEICSLFCDFFSKNQSNEGEKIIAKSIHFIREHLHVNHSVSEYAGQVHLSASYYANLFKKVTGCSVLQFVIQERMEKAKNLLLEGLPVHEAAAAVGYEERSYFSDVFKKQTGQTPTEFKQAYQ